MTDDEIERMVREAEELRPMGLDEFQEETAVIRAYARQAWAAGLEGGSAGGLDMASVKFPSRCEFKRQ